MGNSAKSVEKQSNMGISDAHRKKITGHLNKLLADEAVLYQKTRLFHWNIVGPQFHDLHLFLEGEYNLLAATVDEIAERIRKMGHFSNGSMKQFLIDTGLEECEEASAVTIDRLSELLSDHRQIAQKLRKLITTFEEEYHDVGGADYLTGLLQQHEKSAWMLQATIS